MSYQALEWAAQQRGCGATAKHLLRVLAHEATTTGEIRRRMTIVDLAEELEIGAHQVMRAVARLEEMHLLLVNREKGRSSTYTLRMDMALVPNSTALYGTSAISDSGTSAISDSAFVSPDAATSAISDSGTSAISDSGTSAISDSGLSLNTKAFKTAFEKQVPPPARDAANENDGGGGDPFLQSDLELEALLEELTSITGQLPTNHERAVLAVTDYGEHRRAALRELRKAWPGVTHVGGWLNRVIARLKDEAESAKRPLFPIDLARERWEKYEQPLWWGDVQNVQH